MHEIKLMKSIIKAVKAEMKKEGLKTLTGLTIKTAELGDNETSALEFAFDACLKEARMKPARLEIIKTPVTASCAECGKKRRITAFHHECASCGSKTVTALSCPEMEIVSMEAKP